MLRNQNLSSCKTRAFTLIELLVAVSIILMLISIAMPNYLSARERASQVQCKANLRLLGQALHEYRLDYGRFPLADGCAGDEASHGQTCLGSGPAAMGSWDGVPWVLHELGYVDNRSFFYCPTLAGLFPDRKDFVRYAYNASANDTGGYLGGASHIEKDSGHIWLCRCAWLPASASFNPKSGLIYPAGDDPATGEKNVMENVLRINGAVETVNGRREFLGNMGYAR